MYRCIKTMTIYPNTHVRVGDTIKDSLYQSLDWVEQDNFEPIADTSAYEDNPSDDDINLLDAAIDIAAIGISVASIFGDTTTNDSPSFDGFDGGDFGGGGAGGDF